MLSDVSVARPDKRSFNRMPFLFGSYVLCVADLKKKKNKKKRGADCVFKSSNRLNAVPYIIQITYSRTYDSNKPSALQMIGIIIELIT